MSDILGKDGIVIVGAGPAGLTAAYCLGKAGRKCVVVEATDSIGGISQTVERNGWRFDIGGHRFFTKAAEVESFWSEILNPDEFLLRPRMSRVYYRRKFYDYPLRALNVIKNLGILESVYCLASYVAARLHPPGDQSNFEGWVAARFGWRLYNMFFKTYTEKVWGVPATAIQADWAAQRIKNLSFVSAVINAILPARKQTKITTLIEEFRYPKYGPGMMWERCRELVEKQGSEVRMLAPVVRIEKLEDGSYRVITKSAEEEKALPAEYVISSMPLPDLIQALGPAVPEAVMNAAKGLRHRDFLTVALVIPESSAFPDNWIYIHSPEVRLGRVQNYGSWSPYMVKPGYTCLGLEYFAFEGDDLWIQDDAALIELGKRELGLLGLADSSLISEGYVVRISKAYPMYDHDYAAKIQTVQDWLLGNEPNIFPVGRNGMHRYNNQDHSMLTAMLSVENLLGAHRNTWAVNVEREYQEERVR